MANWYVSSASWSAVTPWAATTARSVGQFIRQSATPTVGNERVFRCTTAGTSGATEPTWTLTKNGTTTDGTAVWTECTGQEAYQAPGAWRPFARLASVTSSFAAAGDTIFVGSAHNETQASAITISPPGSGTARATIVCVDETAGGAVPPTAANLATTANVSTTGANNITLSPGFADFFGVNFNCGSGTSAASFLTNNSFNASVKLANCTIALVGTGNGSVALNNNGTQTQTILENVKLSFSGTGQVLSGSGGQVVWRGGSVIGSTLPNFLFSSTSTTATFTLEGVDLSALGSGKTLINGGSANSVSIRLKNCRFGVGMTVCTQLGGPSSHVTDVINCDSGFAYFRNERYRYAGVLTTDTGVARTGGAADSGVAVSHRLATNNTCWWSQPFEGFPLAVYNPTTGATVTATVYGIANAAALPKNDEFWLQVSYLGSAISPLATILDATKANVLAAGSSLTADTSAWDSVATARTNSTPYTVGQAVCTPNNPGRVFFCTTAGTSAASEPAGFASAVDGGSVTDGGATFRAGVRFKQSVALSSPTPQAPGLITVTPRAGLASTTYYVDPVVTLS